MKLKIRSNNGVPEAATAHYARVLYEARIAFAWGLKTGGERVAKQPWPMTEKEWRELAHNGGVAEFDLALFAAQEMLDAIQRDKKLLEVSICPGQLVT